MRWGLGWDVCHLCLATVVIFISHSHPFTRPPLAAHARTHPHSAHTPHRTLPAGMCLTTVVSYISHSQVWAAEAPGGAVVLGGRSNRAKVGFQQELSEVADAVPEVLPQAPARK